MKSRINGVTVVLRRFLNQKIRTTIRQLYYCRNNSIKLFQKPLGIKNVAWHHFKTVLESHPEMEKVVTAHPAIYCNLNVATMGTFLWDNILDPATHVYCIVFCEKCRGHLRITNGATLGNICIAVSTPSGVCAVIDCSDPVRRLIQS